MEHWPGHCRIFSSITGVYPFGANSTPFFVTIKNVRYSRVQGMGLWGQNYPWLRATAKCFLLWQWFLLYLSTLLSLQANMSSKFYGAVIIASVQFSCSSVSDSLRPHESQHARLPCPSPTPGVHPNSRPSSWWCHPAISSSIIPFSSCPHRCNVYSIFSTWFVVFSLLLYDTDVCCFYLPCSLFQQQHPLCCGTVSPLVSSLDSRVLPPGTSESSLTSHNNPFPKPHGQSQWQAYHPNWESQSSFLWICCCC